MPAHVTGAATDRKDSRKQSANDECLSRAHGCFVEGCQAHGFVLSEPQPAIPESQGEMGEGTWSGDNSRLCFWVKTLQRTPKSQWEGHCRETAYCNQAPSCAGCEFALCPSNT